MRVGLSSLLVVLSTGTVASPSAEASHPTWLDPCSSFLHDPENPFTLDVHERVESFLATGMKTDGYDVPTQDEVDVMLAGFEAARRGKLDDAWQKGNCQQLKKLHYAVRRHIEPRSGRLVTVMWEFGERGADWTNPLRFYHHHGWGLFMFGQADMSSNLAVEVPHACPAGGCGLGDLGTARVGAEAFSADNARYLLINGAPRQAAGGTKATQCDDSNTAPKCPADMAHNVRDLTIFHEFHQEAISDPAVSTVYQPHGFGQKVMCGKDPCDAVVSSGTGGPTALSKKVTAALQPTFTVCHFGVDQDCVFGATKNAQQDDIAARPAENFISVEVRTPINTGAEKDRFMLARTVAQALTE